MSNTELTIALVAVAWLAYAAGAQQADRKQQAAASTEAVQADPLAWLTGWAR